MQKPAGPPKIEFTARTKVYIIIVALVLSAIKTIIPFPYVSKACMLGYKAGCSFAPISTIMLAVPAVIVYVYAKKKKIL
ncbi:MAG: hypothetical protein PVI43_01870 [Candidatus Bathyarchaeota archaeon]